MTKYKPYPCWGSLPHGWKAATVFSLDLGLNINTSYMMSLKLDKYGEYASPFLYTTVADITQSTEILGTMIVIIG